MSDITLDPEDLLTTIAYVVLVEGKIDKDDLHEMYSLAGAEEAWAAAELAQEVDSTIGDDTDEQDEQPPVSSTHI